jgi:hypothetical protein
MDSALRYRIHIARTATKGLNAALALKRLKMLSPVSARQLFNATVAPVIDYASNVWMHAAKESGMATLNKAQKIGAQTITGAFQIVAVAIAEAEAYIRPIQQRQFERAVKLWIGIQTFPDTTPLGSYRQGHAEDFFPQYSELVYYTVYYTKLRPFGRMQYHHGRGEWKY